MIRLRSKPSKKVDKFRTIPYTWDIDKYFYNPVSVFYFEKDGQEFLYSADLLSFFIPEETTLTVEEIVKDTEIDISDWTITKTGDKNPGYTLNELKRVILNYNQDGLFKEEDEGTWIIENKECGVKFDIYIKISKEDYVDHPIMYLGYPEKVQVPYSVERIVRKGSFILTILEIWKKKQLGISLDE